MNPVAREDRDVMFGERATPVEFNEELKDALGRFGTAGNGAQD